MKQVQFIDLKVNDVFIEYYIESSHKSIEFFIKRGEESYDIILELQTLDQRLTTNQRIRNFPSFLMDIADSIFLLSQEEINNLIMELI